MARRSFRYASVPPSNDIIHVAKANDEWRAVRTTCGPKEFFRVQYRGQQWIVQPSKVAAIHFCDIMAGTPISALSQRDRERVVNLRRVTQKYSSEKL
jgi:hypothetical protein